MKTSKKQEMRYEKVIIVINFIIYGGYIMSVRKEEKKWKKISAFV